MGLSIKTSIRRVGPALILLVLAFTTNISCAAQSQVSDSPLVPLKLENMWIGDRLFIARDGSTLDATSDTFRLIGDTVMHGVRMYRTSQRVCFGSGNDGIYVWDHFFTDGHPVRLFKSPTRSGERVTLPSEIDGVPTTIVAETISTDTLLVVNGNNLPCHLYRITFSPDIPVMEWYLAPGTGFVRILAFSEDTGALQSRWDLQHAPVIQSP